MGDARYARCKGCSRTREQVGVLSWTRLCSECAARRFHENADGMHYRSGPAWHRWRQAMAACVGGRLPEDL